MPSVVLAMLNGSTTAWVPGLRYAAEGAAAMRATLDRAPERCGDDKKTCHAERRSCDAQWIDDGMGSRPAVRCQGRRRDANHLGSCA